MSIDETFLGAFSCRDLETRIVNKDKMPFVVMKTVKKKKTIMILKSVNEARTDPFEMMITMITVMSSLMMKMIKMMMVMQLLNLN